MSRRTGMTLVFMIGMLAATAPHLGCGRPLAEVKDPATLLVAVVDTAWVDARADRPQLADGPLWLDTVSLGHVGVGAAGPEVVHRLTRPAGPEARLSDAAASLHCPPGAEPCYVRERGVLIVIDSVQPRPGGYDVIVTSVRSDQGTVPEHTALCHRQLRYRMMRVATGWVIDDVVVLRTC